MKVRGGSLRRLYSGSLEYVAVPQRALLVQRRSGYGYVAGIVGRRSAVDGTRGGRTVILGLHEVRCLDVSLLLYVVRRSHRIHNLGPLHFRWETATKQLR